MTMTAVADDGLTSVRAILALALLYIFPTLNTAQKGARVVVYVVLFGGRNSLIKGLVTRTTTDCYDMMTQDWIAPGASGNCESRKYECTSAVPAGERARRAVGPHDKSV